MSKCEICKYQKDCPDIVEENSVYCLVHRKIPKNFDNEYIEKQQLISFLEDKIKEYKEKISKYDLWHEAGEDINFLILKKQIYQEVLDFIEKGGKDETK